MPLALSKGSLCKFCRLFHASRSNRFPISDCKIPSGILSQNCLESSLRNRFTYKGLLSLKRAPPSKALSHFQTTLSVWEIGANWKPNRSGFGGGSAKLKLQSIQGLVSCVIGRLARRAISRASWLGRRKMSEVNSTDSPFLATTE